MDSEQMFGLITNDLTQIKPNYEAMVKGGTLRITDEGYAQGRELFINIENDIHRINSCHRVHLSIAIKS